MNQQDDRRAIFQGEWRRFSDYEITDGYIRPTKGSTLVVYDPWEGYYAERFGSTSGIAPWQGLYNIGREQDLQGSDKEALCSEKVAKLILTFCKQYGLLGILLHQVHQVVFPPHYDYVSGHLADQWQKEGMTYDEAWAKRQIATLYRRDCFGGWAQVRNTPLEVDTSSVTERSWTPGVLLQPALDKPDLKVEGIRTTWAKYFPDVLETDWETYQTPSPTDDRFWRGYAEPVECFLAAASLVFELCQGLRADRRNRRAEIVELLQRLSTVTASMRPVFRYIHGEYRQCWKSPSLFGVAVMMLGTDLAGHYRFLSCANCGYIFPTKSYQGKFCSQKCRNGFNKRPDRLKFDTESMKRTA